jgi:hypothetical protein
MKWLMFGLPQGSTQVKSFTSNRPLFLNEKGLSNGSFLNS